MQFKTQYQGISIICKVLSYEAGTKDVIHSQSSVPNDPTDFIYELYDELGNRQTWLEQYVVGSMWECMLEDLYLDEVEDAKASERLLC